MTIEEKEKILKIKNKKKLTWLFLAESGYSVNSYYAEMIVDKINNKFFLISYADRGGILSTLMFDNVDELCIKLKKIKMF